MQISPRKFGFYKLYLTLLWSLWPDFVETTALCTDKGFIKLSAKFVKYYILKIIETSINIIQMKNSDNLCFDIKKIVLKLDEFALQLCYYISDNSISMNSEEGHENYFRHKSK